MLLTSDLQTPTSGTACAFRDGDAVYLAKGSYQGTTGTFLQLREDPKWADIRETDDTVRQHPVEWLGLSKNRRT